MLLPNFEPSLSHWISFKKSKEEGNTKSHCGEGSICLFWHEKSFFRIHPQLEVSSLWAFPVLYWLLLSCRKAFKGLSVGLCLSSQKCPVTEFTCSPQAGFAAQAPSGFSSPLGAFRAFPGVCRMWGFCPAPNLGYLQVPESCSALPPAQTPRSQSAARDRMSEAEFINPLRVQLLVGSWEWEVFVCPKNSYPEERIIKAAPFGRVSKMASSSGYSW